VDFRPAMVHINDIGPSHNNSLSDEISAKNVLSEAFAHALFESVALGDWVAAYWFQNQTALLLLQIGLIQEGAKFRVEVKQDVPVSILFPPRAHDDSGNTDTRIDDVKPIFRARKPSVVDMRPKRHVA